MSSALQGPPTRLCTTPLAARGAGAPAPSAPARPPPGKGWVGARSAAARATDPSAEDNVLEHAGRRGVLPGIPPATR
jgi:hypothetical protein